MTRRDRDDAFSIGAWQVCPEENRLKDGDRVVSLEPRVMSVLVCLAHRPGRIVSSDELLELVWQGRAHNDHTVYQAIADLRKALGDDASMPHFIETIPKKGYRLICPVSADVADTVSDEVTPDSHRSYRVIAIIAAFAAAIFLTANLQVRDWSLQSIDEPEEKSIAVLPFVSMSSDPDQEYFSDGLSEEIRTLLSRVPGLKVIGRTSSISFKDENVDIRTVGRTLGVKTVLEGSVRKSGETVRITAQLVDASNGAQIWSETYDRPMKDIFAVQDDVASAVIDALQLHVSTDWSRGRPTDIPEAYTLFLKAKASMNLYDHRFAEKLLLGAIELDPEFAEAYEMLAYAYWRQAGGVIEARKGQRLMGEAAAKALAIDPDLVLARALYRSSTIEEWSYMREIAAFEEAAHKQPNNPELLNALAWDLFGAGYLREALDIAERLVDLDPLSPTANARLFESLYAVGRTEEAMAELGLQTQLDIDLAMWNLGLINLAAMQDDMAITYLESANQRSHYPQDPTWMRDFISSARDPVTGAAYLDQHISTSVASKPDEERYNWQLVQTHWYLTFGYLDRYFEQVLATHPTASSWTDAEELIRSGIVYRRLGFTAHPKYLDVAEVTGIVDVWEQRGPPDFCEKVNDQWICE